MTDFAAMRQQAAPAPAEIKETVPITFVLHHLAGSTFEEQGGEWVTLSPLRLDRNPSFHVWGEHLDRWIDFATGEQGDVFDLVKRLEGIHKFSAQQERVWALWREHGSAWAGPTRGVTKAAFDVEAAERYLTTLTAGAEETLWETVKDRRDQLVHVDLPWLVSRFRLLSDDTGLIVPFLDRNESLVAVKTRRPGSPMYSAPGTSFGTVLYGEWLDIDKRSTAMLCEGESDVWTASWGLREHDVAVLGLPTGAGSVPRAAPSLAGRTVVLAFDGDDAGRRATVSWIRALHTVGANVHVLEVPEGRDVSQLWDLERRYVQALRRSVPPDVNTIAEDRGRYVRLTGNGDPVSNFSLVLRASLIGDSGGQVLRVNFLGDDTEHILRPEDLQTKTTLRKWALDRGRVWEGTDRDTSGLAARLHVEAYGARRTEAVSVAGLYDGHFVWPGGRYGPRAIEYVAPSSGAVGLLSIDPQPEDAIPGAAPLLVEMLYEMHQPAVTSPILAWLAAAPLRSLLHQFPILNVTGSSGSGKTTIVETMLTQFTGSRNMHTLTGTTRFALLAQLQSTNAFPIAFDEYRPGARNATLQELNQLLRDAYTGQSSLKGGASDNWNELSEFQTLAPIIVSGEDSFHETSHLERMVIVALPIAGRNPATLNALPTDTSYIADSYLPWLLRLLDGWAPVVRPAGKAEWNDRQRWNMGVLELGWSLLGDWMQEEYGAELPAPDWSIIEAEDDAALASDPVLEALEWAMGAPGISCVQRVDEDFIAVQVTDFVREVNYRTDITLPGGTKAVSRILATKYGGERVRQSFSGSRVWVTRIPSPASLR